MTRSRTELAPAVRASVPGEPTGERVPRAESSGLAKDDQGAILVLGIFMCVGLAGMLWYLAGIGDAIIYRQRMQEAADATAYSGAVLLARGMNLIVFLNLIMACILAVRVALKVILIITTVLYVIFEILGKIPPLAAFTAAAQGMKIVRDQVDNILEQTHDPINNAIKALNKVETVLGRVIPPAAVAGSIQVGSKYKPMVKLALAGGPATLKGLPIEDDTPDMLCRQAGKMVGWMMFTLIPLPLPGEWKDKFSDMFGKLVEKGGSFFCETGSGSDSAPDFSEELNDLNSGVCDQKKEGLDQDAAEKNQAYQDQCTAYGADCSGESPTVPEGAEPLTAEQQASLANLKADADAASQEATSFIKEDCENEQKDQSQQQMNEAMGSTGGNDSEGSEEMKPKKVDEDWYNGAQDGQVLSLATGDTQVLNDAPKLVQLGAWLQRDYTFKVPVAAGYGVAQAEFFYDCRGKWDGDGNKCLSDEPMWNFRWRARIHRFNFAEISGANAVLGVAFGAEAIRDGIGPLVGLSNVTWGNAQLRTQLVEAMFDDPIIH